MSISSITMLNLKKFVELVTVSSPHHSLPIKLICINKTIFHYVLKYYLKDECLLTRDEMFYLELLY